MLTWRSDIPRWGWGPPALFPADVDVEGPAQERVHECGSSLLAWLLAHNPEDRGGAEESMDRGTGGLNLQISQWAARGGALWTLKGGTCFLLPLEPG